MREFLLAVGQYLPTWAPRRAVAGTPDAAAHSGQHGRQGPVFRRLARETDQITPNAPEESRPWPGVGYAHNRRSAGCGRISGAGCGVHYPAGLPRVPGV